MRVSWNWLNDFVDLSDLKPGDVADKLSLSGLEVEEVEMVGADLESVVVGLVTNVEQHPQADKLNVCTVDDGSGEHLQIVCGANNVRAGKRFPLARIGCVLPGDFKIRKSKIRGVVSFGMLCSARELGLGDDHDGILTLSDDAEIGSPVIDCLGLRDIVFHIDLTANRGDCLSVVGVARELSALYGRSFSEDGRLGAGATCEISDAAIGGRLSVTVEDPAACPRYAAAVMDGACVAPSPDWMQARLRAVGQRPLSNLVDVTNYVNLERGQPLHAFDLDSLAERRIVVRRARAAEKMTTLDRVERELIPTDLLICDGAGPIALAGIMGGADSEVADSTTSIAIECANFDAGTVRRTSRRMALHTDSSHRFERNVDPNGVMSVLDRTIELMVATQPQGQKPTVLSQRLDISAGPFEPARITLAHTLIEGHIGVAYTEAEVVDTLSALGIEVSVVDGNYMCVVPTYRPDLTRPVDIIEEVARVIGFDRIPAILPPGVAGLDPVRREDPPRMQVRQPVLPSEQLRALGAARAAAASSGLFEVVNWSFASESEQRQLAGEGDFLRLRNPLSSEHAVLRRTLLGGLLNNLRYNRNHGAARVALFEVGRVFSAESADGENLEPLHLAVALTGPRSQAWHAGRESWDVHDVVASLQTITAAARRPVSIEPAADNTVAPPPWAHPGAVGRVMHGEQAVGYAAQLHPAHCAVWDLPAETVVAEIDLGALLGAGPAPVRYEKLVRTQGASRDVALVVKADLPWSRVQSAIDAFDHQWLGGVRLFDVYDKLGDGKKSIALSATWRHLSASLTDKQIEKAQAKLVEHLCQELEAERR